VGLYEKYVLPSFINKACGAPPILKQREKVVPHATGRVLEIGMGSGLNLPYYNPDNVEFVWGLEPSEGMRKKAAANVEATPFEVKFLGLPSEQIPLEDNSADTIVLTYTLCTIPDALAALSQMRRVLKPGGKLLFSEHGEAPDEAIARWQQRLDPIWGIIGGGCHLGRPIDRLIRAGGFKIDDLDTMYLPKTPKFAGFNYWGSAQQM
jgi:SAM-dependent methyltransferase